MKKKNIFNVMAIAAVSFFGLTTCVNAESYIATSAPDSLTTKAVGSVSNETTDTYMNSWGTLDLADHYQVIDYHATTGDKLFCLDRKVSYGQGQPYTKSDEKVDYGIVYIIANSEAYYNNIKNLVDSDGSYTRNKKIEQSWFTQMAIWKYLDANLPFNMSASNGAAAIAPTEDPTVSRYSMNAANMFAALDSIVNAAKSAKSTGEITSFNMNFDGNYTVLEDSKSVKTGLFGLADSNNITTYSIDLKNAPSGTKAYTESGSEITDLTSIPAATKLYLVIPVENIENYSFEFDIPASTNNYKFYTGYKYTSGSYQPMTLVVPTTKQIDSSINFKSSKLEDTASSISNSIYFIGFMILLGGMGIIYANTKERKEQV